MAPRDAPSCLRHKLRERVRAGIEKGWTTLATVSLFLSLIPPLFFFIDPDRLRHGRNSHRKSPRAAEANWESRPRTCRSTDSFERQFVTTSPLRTRHCVSSCGERELHSRVTMSRFDSNAFDSGVLDMTRLEIHSQTRYFAISRLTNLIDLWLLARISSWPINNVQDTTAWDSLRRTRFLLRFSPSWYKVPALWTFTGWWIVRHTTSLRNSWNF